MWIPCTVVVRRLYLFPKERCIVSAAQYVSSSPPLRVCVLVFLRFPTVRQIACQLNTTITLKPAQSSLFVLAETSSGSDGVGCRIIGSKSKIKSQLEEVVVSWVQPNKILGILCSSRLAATSQSFPFGCYSRFRDGLSSTSSTLFVRCKLTLPNSIFGTLETPSINICRWD